MKQTQRKRALFVDRVVPRRAASLLIVTGYDPRRHNLIWIEEAEVEDARKWPPPERGAAPGFVYLASARAALTNSSTGTMRAAIAWPGGGESANSTP